jgi:hypothetical protein
VSDTHSGQGAGSQGSGAQGAQSQPGGGQQPGGAAPTGGMPIEQIDRAQQDRRENPNTRGVSGARDQREAAAARAAGQQPPGAEQQPGSQPPAGDAEVTIGDIKIAPEKFREIMARQGAEDARKLTLPTTPEAYTLDLPADFKPPADVKFEFNKDDPTLARARQLALSRGLDQATFSDFLSVYAAERISEATKINTARNAEIQKLGSAAPQRIDAIKTFIHATCGSDLGAAIEQMLCTAKQVSAFEKIIDKFSRQGGTQFSQAHREGAPPAGKIPGYENMTFEQRRAAQMAQNPQAPRTSRAPTNR